MRYFVALLVVLALLSLVAKLHATQPGPGMLIGRSNVNTPLPPGVTPPPQAAAAGFTTLLANFDWSNNSLCATTTGATSQTCVAASPATNWLDCNTSTPDNSKFWHYLYSVQLPCARAGVGTDPVTGKQSLFTQLLSSDAPASAVCPPASPCPNIALYSALQGTTASNTGYTTWPLGAYVEANERLDWTESGGTGAGNTTDGMFLGTNNDPSCHLEFDPGELFAAFNGAGDSGAPDYCGGAGHSSFWVTRQPNFPIAGWVVTDMHAYGALQTTNGSNSIMWCPYIDNTLVAQVGQANGCNEIFEAGHTYTTNRELAAIGFGNNQTTAAPTTRTMWIQWIRVWTCAGGATGQCNGSTLTGSSNSGAVAYWH